MFLFLRGRWRSEAGGALVELAVALPVLVVVFAATIDFARVFHTSMALNIAARAGAQYGAHNAARSSDTTGIVTNAHNATNMTGMTVVQSRSCRCVTDAGVFDPPSDCMAGCVVSKHLVITVTVTATKTFTTVITGFPAIPSSVNLSRSATMRVHQ